MCDRSTACDKRSGISAAAAAPCRTAQPCWAVAFQVDAFKISLFLLGKGARQSQPSSNWPSPSLLPRTLFSPGSCHLCACHVCTLTRTSTAYSTALSVRLLGELQHLPSKQSHWTCVFLGSFSYYNVRILLSIICVDKEAISPRPLDVRVLGGAYSDKV